MLRCTAALALSTALLGGCGPPRPVERRNLVLITVDTMRADRLGAAVAPTLDALAARGTRFTHARTTVPLTFPAHASLLTGALPPAIGVRVNGDVLPSDVPTLATVLHDAGYETGAFIGAFVLDRRFGLARGFDVYDDRVPRDPAATDRLEADRPAGAVIDAALSWLDGVVAGPFFLWVHLYDPHAPYTPPADLAAKYPGRPYDAEIASADRELHRLFERLTSRGLDRRTVVAFAGDHGEGLGDHGEATHGMLAYDTTLRVPLVIAAPGAAAARDDTPISLAQLAPRLLAAVGVNPALGSGATAGRADAASAASIYSETEYPAAAGWSPLAALTGPRWKLIRSTGPELYDVAADPGERTNLAATNRELVASMAATLTSLRAGARARTSAGGSDTQAALRSLGYVGGSAPASGAEAVNPATAIDAWTEFEQASTQLSSGDIRTPLPVLQRLSERFPDGALFQSAYARALQQSGRARDAVGVLRAAVARRANDAALFHDLAVAAGVAGDDAEALRAEQAAIAIDGTHAAALNGLGLLQIGSGHAADAASAFERATTADPSNATYWSNLGNARGAVDDAVGAERAYRRALDLDGRHADAANGLAVLLVQNGRPADAVPLLERVVAAAPDFHEARLNLGIALQQAGQRDRAIAVYRDLLARAPRTAARERDAATKLLASLK